MNVSSPFKPGAQVCAYLRDSGGDEQDLSTEQQERFIRDWCYKNGLILSIIFIDAARPGSSLVGRDQFQAMLTYFRDKKCPAAGLVLWSFSRFSRDINDSQFFKADLRRRGYIIFSITDPVPDGINGVFFENAIDWMNARYLEELSIGIKRGVNHLVTQHAALGGHPPRGFKREPIQLPDRRDGSEHIVHRWVPDPELWEICRTAWLMRAAGKSYDEIRKATKLYKTASCYHTFFRNRLYLGELVFGGQVITNYCEPLISQDIWDKVQEYNRRETDRQLMQADENSNHPRRRGSSYLLSGLVFCGDCGSPLNGKTIYPAGKASYGYYMCSGRKNRRDCTALKMPKTALEDAIKEAAGKYIFNIKTIAGMYASERAALDETRTNAEKSIAGIEARIAGLAKRINNLLELIENGQSAGGPKSVLDRIVAYEQEQADLKSQIINIKHQAAAQKITDNNPDALVIGYQKILADNNPDELRAVYRGFIHRITARRDGKVIRVFIEFYLPPDPHLFKEKTPSNDGVFMPMLQCPRRESNHRHIYNLDVTVKKRRIVKGLFSIR